MKLCHILLYRLCILVVIQSTWYNSKRCECLGVTFFAFDDQGCQCHKQRIPYPSSSSRLRSNTTVRVLSANKSKREASLVSITKRMKKAKKNGRFDSSQICRRMRIHRRDLKYVVIQHRYKTAGGIPEMSPLPFTVYPSHSPPKRNHGLSC